MKLWLLVFLLWAALGTPVLAQGVEWPITGGRRHSSLRDVNTTNVKRLEVAWTYRHGDYVIAYALPQTTEKEASR